MPRTLEKKRKRIRTVSKRHGQRKQERDKGGTSSTAAPFTWQSNALKGTLLGRTLTGWGGSTSNHMPERSQVHLTKKHDGVIPSLEFGVTQIEVQIQLP